MNSICVFYRSNLANMDNSNYRCDTREYMRLFQASDQSRASVPSSTKKPSRGSPKASSARELIEKKGIAQKDEKASTLPRKGAIYAKKDSSCRKVTTLPRNSSENADTMSKDKLL